jgi:hypothetical protein
MSVANFEAQSWPLGYVTRENHNSWQTDRDLTALWLSERLTSFSFRKFRFDDWGVRLDTIAFLAATVALGDKCLPARHCGVRRAPSNTLYTPRDDFTLYPALLDEAHDWGQRMDWQLRRALVTFGGRCCFHDLSHDSTVTDTSAL